MNQKYNLLEEMGPSNQQSNMVVVVTLMPFIAFFSQHRMHKNNQGVEEERQI